MLVNWFWAKLERDVGGQVTAWHSIQSHAADVAACTEALLQNTILGTRLATMLGQPTLEDAQVARLAALAALHDIGKFNHGFQAKIAPGAHGTAGHVAEVLALFGQDTELGGRLGQALSIDQLVTWGENEDAILDLLTAALAHHGRPVGLDHPVHASLWRAQPERDPFAGIQALSRRVREWFPRAFAPGGAPMPANHEFQHAVSGLVTLADWLGSDSFLFPLAGSGEEDRMAFARERASKALARMGLDVAGTRAQLASRVPWSFATIFGLPPRPLQQTIGDLPSLSSRGSIVCLEAETGAGKTEAAFLHFLRLHEAGQADGLYFALPTRTAATQIHRRLVEAVAWAFPDEKDRPPVVLAVPGYLEVDDRHGIRLPGFEVLWDDHERDRWRFRAWAAENPKRFLAGAIVVGTIDQVLLSTLAVRHSHLRAASLLRHLLVIDEVHASDTYMNRLLEEVLRRHLGAGGHALLMSATLGTATLRRFLEAVGSTTTLEAARPYPVVSTWQHAEGLATRPIARQESSRRIRIQPEPWASDPGRIAAEAVSAARGGARVLVLRNTVRDCVATQEALEAVAPDVGFTCAGVAAPHHARFAAGDRRLLDAALEARLGKHSQAGGCVVVATQTVQQSLDLDADLMLTDLAPMDILLQRWGRIHRHASRRRPAGFEVARAIVLMPESRDLGLMLAANGTPRGEHGLGSVYDDLRGLEATWRLIEAHPLLEIPADCREVVEAATDPQVLAAITQELAGRWLAHETHLLGHSSAMRRQADLNLADWSVPFYLALFPSGDLDRRIQTRLGEGDRRAVFTAPPLGPFGQPVAEVTIPAYWLRDVKAEEEPVGARPFEGGFRFQLGTRNFRYDRLGLRPETLTKEDDASDA